MHKSVLSLFVAATMATPLAFAKQSSDAVMVPSDLVIETAYRGGGGGGSTPQRSQPVQQSRPAPVQQSRPAPAQQSRPAPVQQTRPAPVQQSRPAPAQRQEPAQQQRPAPAQRQQPIQQPIQQQRPAPMPQTRQIPTEPNRTIGTQPNRSEPTAPNHTEPTAPNRTEPTAPNRTEPTAPGRTQPNEPGHVNQPKPADRATTQNTPRTPGVQTDRTREARIEAPKAPTSPLNGAPKVNSDRSVTSHYSDGSSVRRAADGRVVSQYDAKDHKAVYSNKDGSQTVAQGARSVRTYENGDKVVRNAGNHETSTFNAARNQTTIRSPGRQVTIDHNTNIVNVRAGRERYEQIPRSDGRGYTRNVTINNINIVRNYNYGYNRFGGYGSYYNPGIYASPYYGGFIGGFYGGFGYLTNSGYYVNPWGYGWSVWNRYPAEICWWGGCNYVGYGYSPFTPVYSWRADYGYYYSPVVTIVNPVDYLLGTLIAESLENRRQSRLDAEILTRQEALEQQQAIATAAQQDEYQAEILRQQAADQLQAAQDERNRNASCIQDKSEAMSQEAVNAQKVTVNHVSTEIAQKSGQIDVVDFLTSEKGVHGFQIHDTLTVGVDGSDNQCNLDEGDVVEVNPGFAVTKDTDNVLVKVLSSVPGDCRPGKVVNVGVEKLQEMLNATVEKVNDAMNDMAAKKMGQQK